MGVPVAIATIARVRDADTPKADDELDARGLVCPEPLMLARNRLRGLPKGAVLYVCATDPSTDRDFANLCRFMGHEMVAKCRHDSELRYWIRRG